MAPKTGLTDPFTHRNSDHSHLEILNRPMPQPHHARLTLWAALALTAAIPAIAQIPAFPGAEGFGAHSTGGRGGDVYFVTNLNGSGAGSLRNGIETAPSSGRTILFAVSGYIPLPGGNLRLVQNKITIAGQTAPGDGIGLRDGTVRLTGNNIILRHLRLRHGKNGSGGDCLNIDSSASDSIIDHVTMQFSTDENISFFSSSLDRFTMQNSVSAWGLETHNAGGLWDLNRGTCRTSLWAHHHTRNPKARPALLEWINNVTYDWGIGMIMGDSQTPASWKANVRGSYFLSPPGRTDNIALEKATIDRNGNPNFSLYLDNCLHDSNGDGILNGTNKGYAIVAGSEYIPAENALPGSTRYIKSPTPFPGTSGNIAVTIDPPLTAFKKVLSNAGALRLDATFPGTLRDEVDTLLFQNLATQTTNRITRESDLAVSNSGFGNLQSSTPPTDSDLDGMPDFWESALGMNPAVPTNNTLFTNLSNTFFPQGTPTGYTHLEEYLHFKAIPHAVVARNTTTDPSQITTDLRKFTSGFTKSPTFSITSVIGGSITQFAANGTTPSAQGPVIRFTPTTNISGRAGFNFTVTDSDGSTWTRQFAILVTNAGIPRDLIWLGGPGNTWDSTSLHWNKPDQTPTSFGPGDTALFDERGSNTTSVNLTETILPGSMTAAGNKSYTLTGIGSIASTGILAKSGDSNLTLASSATFTGGSYLSGGETIIANGGNLAGGPIRFTGGSTLRSTRGSDDVNTLTLLPNLVVDEGATGNLILSQRVNVKGSLSGAGTFNIHSPSNLGTEGRVYLDGSSAACTGNVNLIGGGTGRVAFRTNGGAFNGFNNARLHLDGITVFTTNNSGGNTHAIGSLSGTSNSTFAGAYNSGAGPTTLNIGGLGLDTTFHGLIRDGNTAITHIIKSGNGQINLIGPNTYTGNTTVQSGNLLVSGSLGATPTTVATGATISGSGSLGSSLTLANGALISPGNAPASVGNLTVANGLTLQSGCLLDFDLSSTPSSNNDRVTVLAGTLSQTGSINFRFRLTEGHLGNGTYTLVTGAPNSSASSVNLTHNLPGNTRQSFSMGRSSTAAAGAKSIWLTVTGTAGDLTWTGSSSTWDLATSTPWSGAPAADNRFFNLDRVRFTDTATNRTVQLSGNLQPRRIDATHTSGTYTLTGDGTLTGIASLWKSGAGTLVIANSAANTHTGGTVLEAGILGLTNTASPLGTGLIDVRGGTLRLPNSAIFLNNSMVFSGTSSIASTYSGNSTLVNSTTATLTSSGEATILLDGLAGILSINGRMDGFSGAIQFGSGSGMLRLNSNSIGTNDVNTGSPFTHFNLGTASAHLVNRNGGQTIDLGALSGGPSTRLSGRQSGSGNTSTTYRVGAKNLPTTFSGIISNGNDLAGLHLEKTGTAPWTLAGNSTFHGSLSVEQGSLILPGAIELTGNATIRQNTTLELSGGTLAAESIDASGNLDGHGSLSGSVRVSGTHRGRGTLSSTTGSLSINGDTYFDASSNIHLKVATTPDTIAVTGDLALAGTLHLQTAPAITFGRFVLFTHTSDLELGQINLTGNPSALLSTSTPGEVAVLINDSDADGLPDTWELLHFGNLSRHPSDPNPPFKATIAPTATSISLTWPSAPGIVFEIQRTTSLDTSWQTLTTITGNSSSHSYTDPSPPPDRAFYRIRIP
jgi:autotransporter-associated beta strand protein